MQSNQNVLIEAVTKVNPNVVIVLLGRSPVEITLRSMGLFSGDTMSEDQLQMILSSANMERQC